MYACMCACMCVLCMCVCSVHMYVCGLCSSLLFQFTSPVYVLFVCNLQLLFIVCALYLKYTDQLLFSTNDVNTKRIFDVGRVMFGNTRGDPQQW